MQLKRVGCKNNISEPYHIEFHGTIGVILLVLIFFDQGIFPGKHKIIKQFIVPRTELFAFFLPFKVNQDNKDLMVTVYVIHFKEDALGKDFFDPPEFTHIKELFKRGQQGVLITGNSHRKISDLVKKVYRCQFKLITGMTAKSFHRNTCQVHSRRAMTCLLKSRSLKKTWNSFINNTSTTRPT